MVVHPKKQVPFARQWYTKERASQYDAADQLDLRGWFEILKRRSFLLGLPADPLITQSIWRAVEQNPLNTQSNWLSKRVPAVREQDPITVLRLAHLYASKPWSPWLVQGLNYALKSPLKQQIDRDAGANVMLPEKIPTAHRMAVMGFSRPTSDGKRMSIVGAQETHQVHLTVDLDANDDELRLAFSNWLDSERGFMAKKGLKPSHPTAPRSRSKGLFTTGDLRRWARLRVLQAIDLDLACRMHGWSRPTAQAAGTILFPDDSKVDTTDKVRQQVRPLAARLLSAKTLDAIEIQLAREARDQSGK